MKSLYIRNSAAVTASPSGMRDRSNRNSRWCRRTGRNSLSCSTAKNIKREHEHKEGNKQKLIRHTSICRWYRQHPRLTHCDSFTSELWLHHLDTHIMILNYMTHSAYHIEFLPDLYQDQLIRKLVCICVHHSHTLHLYTNGCAHEC